MYRMLKTVHKTLKLCSVVLCQIFNKSQSQDTSLARERGSKVVSADCKVVPAQFLQLETSVCYGLGKGLLGFWLGFARILARICKGFG